MAGARRASTLLATEPAIADGPDDGASLPDGRAGGRLRRRHASATTAGHAGRCATSTCTWPPAPTSASSAAPAAARRRSAGCSPGSGTSRRRPGPHRRGRRARPHAGRAAAPGRGRHPGRRAVPGVGARQPDAVRHPRRHRRRAAWPCSTDVGLGAWFAALPDGLDTVLDGGQGLSAGEGQLLAFARAFLADPAVVVLDEASSRLDPLTEARIGDATRTLLAGRTAVIIAHRLDTLDRVDEIAVLEGGRVVEHGPRVDARRGPDQPLRPAAPHGARRQRRRRVPLDDDAVEEVDRDESTPHPTGPRHLRSGRGRPGASLRNEPRRLPGHLGRLGHLLRRCRCSPASLVKVAARPRGRRRHAAGAWALLGVLGRHRGRALVDPGWCIAVQWHGCWVGWQTVPRVNVLRSLVATPGPAAGGCRARRARR